MPKSAIVLILFWAASKDLKVNVSLHCQQMLKLLEFLKKQSWVDTVVLILEWLLIRPSFERHQKRKGSF